MEPARGLDPWRWPNGSQPLGTRMRTTCKDAILFLVFFFRPPDKPKNPHWSDFKYYSIRRSDWSATCHDLSSHVHSKFKILCKYIFKYIKNRRQRFEYIYKIFLPHSWHMSPLDSSGKLYKHRYNCFLVLGRPLLAFSILQRSSIFFIFGRKKINYKKYQLAPTDFASKKAA